MFSTSKLFNLPLVRIFPVVASLSREDDDYWDLHLLPAKQTKHVSPQQWSASRQDVLSADRTGQTERVLGGFLGGSMEDEQEGRAGESFTFPSQLNCWTSLSDLVTADWSAALNILTTPAVRLHHPQCLSPLQSVSDHSAHVALEASVSCQQLAPVSQTVLPGSTHKKNRKLKKTGRAFKDFIGDVVLQQWQINCSHGK